MLKKSLQIGVGFLLPVLVLGVAFAALAQSSFGDVPSSHWSYNAVNYASTEGLMTGYDNGNFGPDDTLTRAQLAMVLCRQEKGVEACANAEVEAETTPAKTETPVDTNDEVSTDPVSTSSCTVADVAVASSTATSSAFDALADNIRENLNVEGGDVAGLALMDNCLTGSGDLTGYSVVEDLGTFVFMKVYAFGDILVDPNGDLAPKTSKLNLYRMVDGEKTLIESHYPVGTPNTDTVAGGSYWALGTFKVDSSEEVSEANAAGELYVELVFEGPNGVSEYNVDGYTVGGLSVAQ